MAQQQGNIRPYFAVGQHVRHVDSGRNAFVNVEPAEKMLFYFPGRNRTEQRWSHTFRRASALILDDEKTGWTPGIDKHDKFGGRIWWEEDDGQCRSIGSRGDVVVAEGLNGSSRSSRTL